METKTLVGHILKNSAGQRIDMNGAVTENPSPISLPEAYRYIASAIEKDPSSPPPSIEPVYNVRQLTPLETASGELADLLMSLTRRHGLDLGMTRDQITTQVAKELCELASKR